LETWSWIYGRLVDAYFLTVAWLELGSVLTFGKVNLGLVLMTLVVWEFDSDISVLGIVATALILDRLGVLVVTARDLDVDVSSSVLVVYGSAFFTDVNVFSARRTSGLVSIFLASDVYLFLAEFFAGAWREVGGEGRLLILSFPSDAVLLAWEMDLTLDMSRLGGFLNGVAPVRRREDAEGDRDAGVKVQVDGLLCARERLLECLSTKRKEHKKGSLASWVKEGEEESAFDDAS
jgi:hypothetical protein